MESLMVTLHITKDELSYLKKILSAELHLIEDFMFVRKKDSLLLKSQRATCLKILENVKKKCSIVKKQIKEKK